MPTAARPRDEPIPGTTTFPVANRARRAVWGVVWAVFGRCSPRPAHRWRAGLLRAFGARLGRDVHVYPGARIWAPWLLEMGDRSALADGVDCYNQAPVTLGNDVVVSQRTFLCAGNHDATDPRFPLTPSPITIGSGAWIAAEAFVAPGVTVGAGAVVQARSVVTGPVPSCVTVGGHPATVIPGRPGRAGSWCP